MFIVNIVCTTRIVDNRPGGSSKSCCKGFGEVSNVAEGKFPRHNKENELENDEAVDEETDHHRQEVHAQLSEHHFPAFHFQHLGSHQEEDTDR